MQKVNVDVLIWNELRSNDRFGFSSSATCRFLNYRLTIHSQTPLRKGSARVAESSTKKQTGSDIINHFPLVVFFRKKLSRAESCAEELTCLLYSLSVLGI